MVLSRFCFINRLSEIGLLILFCPGILMLGWVQSVQAEDRDLDELYQLCSEFPYNSACEGLEFPVPLDNQPGTLVGCGFKFDTDASSSNCRVMLGEDALTVFIEAGEKLDLLDNERASEAIAIPFSHIFTSDLRIWATGIDAASFFVSGNVYVLKDEDYEGFEREFDPDFDDDERGGFGDRDFAEIEIGFMADAPTDIGNLSNILQITASEEFGIYLMDQLTPVLPNIVNNSLLSQLTLRPVGEVDPIAQAEQIAQLEEDEICIRCDLRGANLSGIKLDDANLEGSNLAGANLQEAEIEDVYLVGANLDEANLTEADLSGGRLTFASLVNSNLTQADLNVVNFQQANLTGATLTNANLGGGNFDYATLTNANLTEADLTNFTAVGFIPFLGWNRFKLYTTLRHVRASGAIFQNADLDRTRLDEADLTGANFTGVDVKDTDLTRADLTGAIANSVNFTDAKLCETTLPDGSVNNQDCDEDEAADDAEPEN